MSWFAKEETRESPAPRGKLNIVEGMWIKCHVCRGVVYRKELEKNLHVCPKCAYHFPISISERVELLLDPETFEEWDAELSPQDPLAFIDTKPYSERIQASQKKTGRKDALVIGAGKMNGRALVLGVFDFRFMGGSMGSVVGEKICRAVDYAMERKWPFLLVTTSGGARMQEGTLSLMQMAKTSAALACLDEAGLPFVTLLTDPTFGGVTASVAMLGDVIMAEPKALIGFAGPRVIEQTIKQRLPEGFQRAEFLLDHGMIDMIVSRPTMKKTISCVLDHLSPQ